MQRIVAISDLHGLLPNPGVIPECDVLIVAGDVCPVWNHDEDYQYEWLDDNFTQWLEGTREIAGAIVGIGGNHDFVLQSTKIGYDLPWIYLDNEVGFVPVIEDGQPANLKVWGSPLSNKFGNWAFMTSEDELRKTYEQIPRDIDILVTHGPANGFGDEVRGFDMTKRGMTFPQHVGSTSLANQLHYDVWPNLKLHVWGHIHEGYGRYNIGGHVGLNAARVDEAYEPVNDPWEILI